MAYGVRYSCEWRAPMRDKHLYRIEILERDYEGEAGVLHPCGNVLEITHGNIDDNELVALRGSEATLSLLCTDPGDPYLELFTTDAQRFKLRISLYQRGRYLIIWQGFLGTSGYNQSYDNPPYRVSLSAVDGLALLDSIPYLDDNGERYTGVDSVGTIVSRIMGKVGVTSVKYMPMMPIRPAQEGHTIETLGVDAKAIYSTIGESASCRSVLEALLQSLGLQIFQSFGGSWRVRSVASLINTKRVIINETINNGGKDIELFSDTDDKGVSTSAILSLLPPYKAVAVERPEIISNEDLLVSMLDGSRWKVLGQPERHPYTWTNGYDYLRIEYDEPTAKSTQYYGCYYVADSQLLPGSNVDVEVVFDAINLSGVKGSLRIGMFLVDGAEKADEWLTVDRSKGTLLVGTTKVLGIKQGAWQGITEREPNIATVFDALSTEVEMESTRWVPTNMPWDTTNFIRTSVSIKGSGIPIDIDIKSWHVVVVILGTKGKTFPEIEMHAPTIKLTQRLSGTPQVTFGEESISADGLQKLNYKQHFGDSWLGLSSGSSLDAPFLDIEAGTPIRTFVAPMQRCLLADTIVGDIRSLRRTVARQLEGEVYSGKIVDLDASWVDREGRKYYTNYIARHLKRGVDALQLRELPKPPANELIESMATLNYAVDSVVGLDTCAYIAVLNSRSVYRYDLATDKFTHVLSSPNETYAVTLNEGQRCACIVVFDGVYYSLHAYDTDGKLLSRIDNANGLVTIGQPYYDAVFRSASYDANTKLWSMVGGTAAVTYMYIVHGDGRVLTRSIYTADDFLDATEMRLIPNGFTYVSAPLTTSLFRTLWHSNAQHSDATVAVFAEYVKVLSANETFFALDVATKGKVGLYARTDTLMGYDTTALWSEGSAYWRFVGMNNAIALFMATINNGAVVYDGRTNLSYHISWVTGDMKLWLSGEYICALVPYGKGVKVVKMRLSVDNNNNTNN